MCKKGKHANKRRNSTRTNAFDLSERLITGKLPQLKLSQVFGYVVCMRHLESHIYHPVACRRGCGINHGQSKESENSLWGEMAFSLSLYVDAHLWFMMVVLLLVLCP